MEAIENGRYTLQATDKYAIERNCAGCGEKSRFVSADKLRSNANGKLLDVWLIYKCERCKHTYNLPVYSRVNRQSIAADEFAAIQRSDPELIFRYAMDRSLLRRNGARIADEPPYELIRTGECEPGRIIVHNPHFLKLRPDKVLCECARISRSQARRMLDEGTVILAGEREDELEFRFLQA